MPNLLARIPRETKVAAAVLGVALLQVAALAALGLGQTERRREDAEEALRLRAGRAVTTLVATSVQQVAGQEERLVKELARDQLPAPDRAQEALRRAPLFTAAHLIDARGDATDSTRPPFEVPESALDIAARRRVEALLAAETADPAHTADAAGALADDLVRTGCRDAVSIALALQCGARAARAAGDDNRAIAFAKRILDRYRALRDDRAVEGEREPFGPSASYVVCEAWMRSLDTADDATGGGFVSAVLDRRTGAQRLRGVLSEAGYRVERAECERLRRAAVSLRKEFQDRLDADLRACDAVDAALDLVRSAPRARVLAAAAQDEAVRVPLPDGSLLTVIPVAHAEPWTAVAFTAPAEKLRATALAGEVGRVDAPEGTAIVVRDAAGTVVAGRPVEPTQRTLAEQSFGAALPGLVAYTVLVDPAVIDREADAARRDWLWVLGAAILAVSAASLLAMRSVMREVRLARLKSDFVSNLSHELRTPLTSVRMFVETLREGRVRDAAETQECLDVIAQETDRLASLVDRVLQFAAFSRGRAPIDLRTEDLGDVVRRAAAVFGKRAEVAGAALDVRIAPDLPAAVLDRDAIVQVILNLLDNAVKHAGHDRPRIRLTAAPHGRGTAIAVEDDGPGIPERERELVFEEFYRGDDTLSRRTQGAGLGLALSRRIVLAHGGTIEAGRSHDLGGAAFRIVLPDAGAGRRPAAPAEGGTR